MFTGIVEALGAVRSLDSGVLIVDTPEEFNRSAVDIGESVAVNGCCLTVVTGVGGLRFDVSPETMARTALGGLHAGSSVNLERAIAAGQRFGGHFLQGHVDSVGEIACVREEGNASVFRFRAPAEFDRYLVDKGSVGVDGISLTVVVPERGEFDVWVVPHTLQATNLAHKAVGDKVNLEFDLIAKYIEKLTAARA